MPPSRPARCQAHAWCAQSAAHTIGTRATPMESSALFARPHDCTEDFSSNDEALIATIDNGIELIKDRVSQLSWEDVERLVAGLFKAMGYCARVTPKCPDDGRYVIASPRRARVRISTHRCGGQALQGSHGRTHSALVHRRVGCERSWALRLHRGFHQGSPLRGRPRQRPVRLLDLDAFVRHYVEVYDEARSILPLTRICLPA